MMTVLTRASADSGKRSRRFERSGVVGIERDRALGASLSAPIEQQLLETLDTPAKPQGRTLVPLDRTRCPDCGEQLRTTTTDQLPLLRHGGYGEAQRTVRRFCHKCGWMLIAEKGAVRP